MMNRLGTLALVGLVAACGGGNAGRNADAPHQASPTSDDVHREVAQGQLKVAHYATGDGMVGFVLDRTGERPKMRMDGDKDILELTIEEERHGTDRTGSFFLAPDGHRVLYLSVNGAMKVFTPSNTWGAMVNSDKAADPLPAPTVRAAQGPATTTTDPSKGLPLKSLAAIAVRARLSQFQPEDSGNLAKLADAFGRVGPELFVRLTDHGASTAHWAPASNHIGGEVRGPNTVFYGLAPSEESWDKSKPGLMRYGAKVGYTAIQYGQPARGELKGLKGWSPVLAAGTPGLVWETEPKLVFVTVDGGRYQFDADEDGLFVAGWGAASSWPPALQQSLLDVDSIGVLAQGGAIADQTRKEIEMLATATSDCVSETWRASDPEIEKIKTSSLPANEKRSRISAIAKKAELSVPTKCGNTLKQLEVGLTKVIEARNVERQAILEKARARAK